MRVIISQVFLDASHIFKTFSGDERVKVGDNNDNEVEGGAKLDDKKWKHGCLGLFPFTFASILVENNSVNVGNLQNQIIQRIFLEVEENLMHQLSMIVLCYYSIISGVSCIYYCRQWFSVVSGICSTNISF